MSKKGVASCGLFAGIGGIERGLEQSGFSSSMLCDIDPYARDVLERRFGSATIRQDVSRLERLPPVSVLAAGFPCQDVSQAGLKAGVDGSRFRLVDHVFRLLDAQAEAPPWLVLENVPFMLRLNQGAPMNHLVRQLSERGFRWAYRTVDARSFGVPQRRRRVILLASKVHDPVPVLLEEDAGEQEPPDKPQAFGFYWTEGGRGLGLALDAVPPLKGGFGLGIPSAPAIWIPSGDTGTSFGIPDIRDLERLQGFPANWTKPRGKDAKAERARWRLVGNAVCVGMSRWLGGRLRQSIRSAEIVATPLGDGPWPAAGWGDSDGRWRVDVSPFPVANRPPGIKDFLEYDLRPLSHKAASGFLRRAKGSTLNFPEGMLDDLELHIAAVPALGSAGRALHPVP
jgi:DNA (cytosine-5)-methyltransferase 1